eukprot:gene17603-20052_t
MKLILQYYAIIQHEIAASREQLIQENIEKDLLYKQASVLRDIRLFACHLMIESRGKLSFTMLPPDSQQFARCVKAVMDNIRNDNLNDIETDLLRNKIKVLNVFKLQNSFLSTKLQAASERVMNGKIKGLFCCLPPEHFCSFSVFGLHAQALPYKANANLQQLAGELFSTAWFHSEPPVGLAVSLRQNKDIAGALRVAGTAARLSVQRHAVMEPTAGKDRTKAPPPQAQPQQHILRFSRYSTISNLRHLSQASLEGGVFLALCRVLVVQQLTVNTPIGDADIMAGLQQGCDCIFSSANEEYVLLQPKFVLPEFFMHVQFPVQVSAASKASSGNKKSGVNTSTPTGILSLPPDAVSTSKRSPSKGRAGDRENKDNDCLFPLENLFLQNASHHLETENKAGVGSNIAYEAEESAEVDDSSLQQTLLKKQAIVQALQTAVRDFKRDKDTLVLAHVRNIAAKRL